MVTIQYVSIHLLHLVYAILSISFHLIIPDISHAYLSIERMKDSIIERVFWFCATFLYIQIRSLTLYIRNSR